MPFCWRANNDPLLVALWSPLPLSTKKRRCQCWTPSSDFTALYGSPNPIMSFIFPISCILALIFPILIKYFPKCEGKGSFLTPPPPPPPPPKKKKKSPPSGKAFWSRTCWLCFLVFFPSYGLFWPGQVIHFITGFHNDIWIFLTGIFS